MTRRITKKKDKQRDIRVLYNNKKTERRIKNKSYSKKLIKNKDILDRYGGNRVVNRDIQSVKIQRGLSGGSDYATDLLKKALEHLNTLKGKLNNIQTEMKSNNENFTKLNDFMSKDFKLSALGFFNHNTVYPLNKLEEKFKYLKMFQYTPDIITDDNAKAILADKKNFVFTERRGLKNRIYSCIHNYKQTRIFYGMFTLGSINKIANQLICAISKFRVNEFEVTKRNYDIYTYLLKYEKQISDELKDDSTLTVEEKQNKNLFTSGLASVKSGYENSVKTVLNNNSPINYTVFEPIDLIHGTLTEKMSFYEYIIGIMKKNSTAPLTPDEQQPILKAINKILEKIILAINTQNDQLYPKYFEQTMQNNIQQLCVMSAFIKEYKNLMSKHLFEDKLRALSYSLIFRDLGYYIELSNSSNYDKPYYELPYYLKFYINKIMPDKSIDLSHIMPNDIGIPGTLDTIKNYKLTTMAFIAMLWNSYKSDNTDKWKTHKNYDNILQSIFLYINEKLSKLSTGNDTLNVIQSNLNYGFFIDYVFNTINYVNTYESILTRMINFTKFYRDFDDTAEKTLFKTLDGVGCTVFEIAKKIITSDMGGFKDGIIRYQINTDGNGTIANSQLAQDVANYLNGVIGFVRTDTQYVGETDQIEYFINTMAKICGLKKEDDKTNTILVNIDARKAISEAAKHTNPYPNEQIDNYINPDAVATAAAVLMNKYFFKTTNRGDIVLNSLRGRELSTGLKLADGLSINAASGFEYGNVEAAAAPSKPVAILGANQVANQGGLTPVRKSAEYMRILNFVPEIAEIMFEMIIQERTSKNNNGTYLMNINLQAHILSGLDFTDAAAVNGTFFNGAPIAVVHVAAAGAIVAITVQAQIDKLHDIAKQIGYGGMEVIVQMAINMSNAFCHPGAAELCRIAAANAGAGAPPQQNIAYSSMMSAYASGFWDKTRLYAGASHIAHNNTNTRAAGIGAGAAGNTFFHAAKRSLISNNDAANIGIVAAVPAVNNNVGTAMPCNRIVAGGHAANNNDQYSGGFQYAEVGNGGNPKSGIGAGDDAAVHVCGTPNDLDKYKNSVKVMLECLVKHYEENINNTTAVVNELSDAATGTANSLIYKYNAKIDNTNKITASNDLNSLVKGVLTVFRNYTGDSPIGLPHYFHNTAFQYDVAFINGNNNHIQVVNTNPGNYYNYNSFVNSSLARAVARAVVINSTCQYLRFKARIINMQHFFNNNGNGFKGDAASETILRNAIEFNNGAGTISKPSNSEDLENIIFKTPITTISNFDFKKFKVAYDNIMIHMARFCYADIPPPPQINGIDTTKNHLYSIFLKFLKTTAPALKKIILYNAAHKFIYLYNSSAPYKERRFLDVISLLQLYEKTLNGILTGQNLFDNIKVATFDAGHNPVNATATRKLLKTNLIVIMMKISHLFEFISNDGTTPIPANQLPDTSHPKLVEYFNEIHGKTDVATNHIVAATFLTVFGFSSVHHDDNNANGAATNIIEYPDYHMEDF